MTERKVRGLEDREAQERKALLRDVRSPVHQVVDALKNGTGQTCGVFGAGNGGGLTWAVGCTAGWTGR